MSEITETLNQVKALMGDALKKKDAMQVEYAEYNKIAPLLHDICLEVFDFLNTPDIRGLSRIQPDSLKKKIEETQNRIAQVKEGIAATQELNVTLLDKEEQLKEKEAEFNNLNEKISWLKEIEGRVSDQQMEELMRIINQETKVQEDRLEMFFAKVEELNIILEEERISLDTQWKSSAEALQKNKDQLASGKKENIKLLTDNLKALKSKFSLLSNEYNQLREEYVQHVEKLKDVFLQLEQIEKDHQANLAIYRKHFEENKELWGDLNENGTAIDYVKELVCELDKKLVAFDEELRQLIMNKEVIAKREQGWKSTKV